jgi:transcriptional regulator with XRE-family HTH domain
MKRQRHGTPRRWFGPGVKSTERTLGILLRQSRLSRGLSLRKVAFSAGFTPMYLSLLERDACGPPSDEKLEALTLALGEPHSEIFFAKAGRVHPRVVDIVLQHPSEWTELLEAGKDLDSDHIESLKTIVNGTPGITETLALLHIIRAATQKAQATASENLAELSTVPLGGMPATVSAIGAIQQAVSATISENLAPATLSAIAAIQKALSAKIPGNLEPVLSGGEPKVQVISLPGDVRLAGAQAKGTARARPAERQKPAHLPSRQAD